MTVPSAIGGLFSSCEGRAGATALFAIRDVDDCFQIRPTPRASDNVTGDLFGERGRVGVVVEPNFLINGDTGSVRQPDAHGT